MFLLGSMFLSSLDVVLVLYNMSFWIMVLVNEVIWIVSGSSSFSRARKARL